MSKVDKYPLIRKIWGFAKEEMTLVGQQRVANYWNPVINKYFDGDIKRYSFTPLANIPENKKIIWQYWGQGLDPELLPEIVRACFASVDKYKGEYEIIRLNDDNIKNYIDFPAFIWEKIENQKLRRVFFSDILRLALLNTYGGVWLDATILLTGPLPQEYTHLDYFLFQRDDNDENKTKWDDPLSRYWGWKPRFKVKVLNSIIFGKKNCEVNQVLMDLLLYYWETQDKALTYFFFQILYHELMENYLPDKRCPVVSDCIPHLLQVKLFYPKLGLSMSYEDILKKSNMHKLTYLTNDRKDSFHSFIDWLSHYENINDKTIDTESYTSSPYGC